MEINSVPKMNTHNWKTTEDLRVIAQQYKSAVYDDTHLGRTWKDKPHRNIYDLVNLVRQLADKLDVVGLPKTETFSGLPDIPIPFDCSFELIRSTNSEKPWGWAFNDHTDTFCGPATYLSEEYFATMAEAMANLKIYIETHYPKQ